MPSVYIKKKEGLFYDAKTGRTMEHRGYATRIYWSTAMLDYLRRHFPTTKNDELAGCLGVSHRTMIRKARELGLQKDPVWLQQVWDAHRLMAHAANTKMRNPNSFKPGIRHNPAGEFKPGHQLTPEQNRKRIESVKRWCLLHPNELKARAAKIWETRRRNAEMNKNK